MLIGQYVQACAYGLELVNLVLNGSCGHCRCLGGELNTLQCGLGLSYSGRGSKRLSLKTMQIRPPCMVNVEQQKPLAVPVVHPAVVHVLRYRAIVNSHVS